MIDRTEGALEALGWVLLTMERMHVTGPITKEVQSAINDLLRGSAVDFKARIRVVA
jgi:hypothetical protein